MEKNYNINTKVIMKKGHPCGTNLWEIVRLGADIKIKCINCGRVVMLPRMEFNKKIKKIGWITETDVSPDITVKHFRF